MRHHWLRDPSTKLHIHPYWDKGPNVWADYFIKTHTTPYHRTQRPNYIKDKDSDPSFKSPTGSLSLVISEKEYNALPTLPNNF